MHVNLISDLHLELADLRLPGGDLLILAGDVCEATNIKPETYREGAPRTSVSSPDRFARFFIEELKKYKRVLYVPGNHEHYMGRFDLTKDLLTSVVPDNCHVMDRDVIELEDVVFLGTTLWTDLNRNNPNTDLYLREHLNDYWHIKTYRGDMNEVMKLTPADTYKAHQASLNWLSQELEKHQDKKCVVITHHLPSLASVPDRFKYDHHMNGGFTSNLDQFILDHPQIKIWCHGHTHDPCNYMIGDTKILCNPRGYVGYEISSRNFDPGFGFDI